MLEIEEESGSTHHVSTSLNATEEDGNRLLEDATNQPPSCLNLSEKKPAANSIMKDDGDLSFDSFSKPDAILPERFNLE